MHYTFKKLNYLNKATIKLFFGEHVKGLSFDMPKNW